MRKDAYEPLLSEHPAIDGGGGGRTPPGRVTLTMQLAPPVQRKESVAAPSARAAAAPSDDPQVAAWPLVIDEGAIAARGVAGAGEALPYRDELKRSFGRHGGALDGVRAHTGADATAAARAIGADAYATGRDIALAAAPTRALVAHEAAHVVQQQAGVALSGGVGAAGDVYERNAVAVGAAFAAGAPPASIEALLDELAGAGGGGGGGGAVQRKESGVRSDERMGEGAGHDIHTHITNLTAHGHQTAISLGAGRKQGVRQGVGMPGYLSHGGVAIATFEIDSVDDKGARAVVPIDYRFLRDHPVEVVINPSGGLPALPQLARDYATRVINVMVEGEHRTRVTFRGGLLAGVQVGMQGELFGEGGRSLGAFTIDQVNPTGCSAVVHYGQDFVAHATAKLNTAGAVA